MAIDGAKASHRNLDLKRARVPQVFLEYVAFSFSNREGVCTENG